MLRSLPSATDDDAVGTLYEPTAVFGQFLGSASMTFFILFSFPCFLLVFSCFSCLFFSFLSFPLLCIVFSFLCFSFPIDLRTSCVWVVMGTITRAIYVHE